jgi:NADH dehydrogenase
LATGARHAYFGHDEWEPYALGLRTIEDATTIRRRILAAFERAERETDETERAKFLTFVIIGAGPTGVELAGTIAELARDTLRNDFRNFDTRNVRVVLIEAGCPPLVGGLFFQASRIGPKVLNTASACLASAPFNSPSSQ